MQKSKNIIIIALGLVLIIILSIIMISKDRMISIGANDLNHVLNNESSLSLDSNYLYIKTPKNKYKIARELIDIKSIDNYPIEIIDNFSLLDFIGYFGILVVLLLGIAVLWNAFYRVFNKAKALPKISPSSIMQKNDLQIYSDFSGYSTPKIKFCDIAGIKEVKDDFLEIIDYLKNPNKYKEMGISLPKGILLIGPPGVGKTMIARAIASQSNVPFFYQSGSGFAQIYVGVGAKRVQELFARARMHSPSIIFIDEVDAVGKARGGNRSDEREATLNQLLIEMDGFENSKEVIVIAATNNVEVLDPALIRAGRFDRRIYIDLPNFEERINILNLYLRNKKHNVNVDEIARQMVGCSGALIASLVNEASLNALRENRNIIDNNDFFATKDKMLSGFKKQLSFSENEKNILSLYQAAKAIVAYWCDVDFDKVMLIGSNFKDMDKNIFSKTDLINKIKIAMSGNVVLELFTGEVYTNNKDDVALIKDIAFQMSEQYAMASRIITDSSDVLQILDDIKKELIVFFKNAKSALQKIQTILLKDEKITKDRVGEILKEEMFL